MYLDFYLEKLNYKNIPKFLIKYLKTPSLLRLKKVGYFCGMDYASKDIYNFREYISRFDHSLTVSLLVYYLTKDKISTLAGLFHDVATPCFSHVIDYMNEDFDKQESTEEFTEEILKSDKYLEKCLEDDGIKIEDIIDYKKYPIVDNSRPKLCADRVDGVILTGIAWTKNISKEDIRNIVEDLVIFENEEGEKEIGFKTLNVAQKVLEVSESIDQYCHSNEDNYMMCLLAKITKLAINKNYITYKDLYSYNEEELFDLLKNNNDQKLKKLITTFETIKINDIPKTIIENVKIRDLNPLVNGQRLKLKAITIADNEAYLRQISKPVELSDKNLKSDILVLEHYCKKNAVLAMAAVQLGIPKRLIYLKNTNLEVVNRLNEDTASIEDEKHNEARVLINPVVISREGLTDYWEACASCLENLGHVKRPYRIKIEYLDIDGKKHSEIFEGFESTVLSHELDHLDGILHMDIADEVLIMSKEERKIFRKDHNYNVVSKTGKFEDLL